MTNSKKFFDIIPPQQRGARAKEEQDIFLSEFKAEPEKPIKPKEKGLRPSFIFKRRILNIAGLFALLFSGAVLLCHFALAKIEITIWPKTEPLSFSEDILLDVSADKPDSSRKIIPAKIFEKEQELSQKFETENKVLKQGKAGGIIRVYNAYSTQSQALVVNTRFVSDDGKLFRSVQRVVIPGATYQTGVLGQKKLEPGYLDIQVEAAEPGPDYNIGPATFSIPGFAGTAKYTAFYGKSFSAMTGGFEGEVFLVSENDLERAEKNLIERAEREGRQALSSDIPDSFVMLKDSLSQEVLDVRSMVKQGAETRTFNLKLTMKTTAFALKKTDGEMLAKEFVGLRAEQGKKIQPGSLVIEYILGAMDLQKGRSDLAMNLEANLFLEPEPLSVKRAVAGKPIKQALTFLRDQPQINKASASVFPFWLKIVPQKIDRIKITVETGL